MTREWQFDGLVGPTHNYAGLAAGNLAAAANAGAVSNPRAAALQGLEKMRFVRNLGVPQAFLPPHYRPALGVLRTLGFSGSTAAILEQVYGAAPWLLSAVFSSSFMWAANAATVSPSSDTADAKLHFMPANLMAHLHRSIEADFSKKLLQHIFHNPNLFSIHNALPSTHGFGDEGAANHMRVKSYHDRSGINIFVYGKSHDETSITRRYGARQERLASEAVARQHGLDPKHCLFLQQSPEAIDQGVFHNDVIAMNHGSLMIAHERAFTPEDRDQLQQFFADRADFCLREVTDAEMKIEDAVATYFYNSQLLEPQPGKFTLVAPSECGNHAAVEKLIHRLQSEGLVQDVHYLDVRESMRNGGGPACLRLRVAMNEKEAASIHPGVILTDEKYDALVGWVNRHYRDRLSFDNLRDPQFVNELGDAYRALEPIIGMPGLYDEPRATQ